jgi:hypothetical protein
MDPAVPPSPGEPALALLAVTHKPVTGQARQFDGTLEAFLDIINARPKGGLTAACHFNEAGEFASLRLDGWGESITLNVGDWVIFSADPGKPPISMPNDQALAEWSAT